jgi:molybdate transport system regulatory protein
VGKLVVERLTIKIRGRRQMKYGARNQIIGKVKSIKKGEIMSIVKFDVSDPIEIASVLTTESLDEMNIKKGAKLRLVIKAIHVLPVKE